jgi:hypothetical protein
MPDDIHLVLIRDQPSGRAMKAEFRYDLGLSNPPRTTSLEVCCAPLAELPANRLNLSNDPAFRPPVQNFYGLVFRAFEALMLAELTEKQRKAMRGSGMRLAREWGRIPETLSPRLRKMEEAALEDHPEPPYPSLQLFYEEAALAFAVAAQAGLVRRQVAAISKAAPALWLPKR